MLICKKLRARRDREKHPGNVSVGDGTTGQRVRRGGGEAELHNEKGVSVGTEAIILCEGGLVGSHHSLVATECGYAH